MGLFSGKKKIYVSSVVYPLGEDDEDAVDYMQYTVLNASMQGRPLGDAITQGYLKGQGMSLRNSFRYARDHYAHGVPKSAAQYLDQPSTALITPIVQPKFPGAQILYLTTFVGPADHEWWAEEHLTKEYGYDRVLQEFARPPQGVEADANVAYDLEPDGLIRILLMNADGSTRVIDFRPTGWQKMATYLHCAYQAKTVFTEKDETVTRAATTGETDSVTVSSVITNRVGELQEKVTRVEVDVSGSTATVRTLITITVTTRPQYLLYKLGSGTYPTIDAWAASDDLSSPYWPSIPLRVNNVDMVSEAKKSTDLYKTSKKLLKRVGADIDKLGKQVNDNDSVRDIDFAFVVFGVALNTKSQEGKRYLYRYFEYLRGINAVNPVATKVAHTAWVAAFMGGTTNVPPTVCAVEVYSEQNRADNHDIKIQWDYIDTTLQSGEVFPGAKPGDVTISIGTQRQFHFGHLEVTLDSSLLYAKRQIDENTYEQLEISGLVHENYIYKGKHTSVTAFEAFTDANEEGFIVPLNHQIVRATPLVELTNLSYQVCHMVFNCYKVVKQKWYQTGIFKIILIIIAIILCYFFPPAGVSMLAAVIGTVLVVSAIVALIIAATIYVLAMMLLMNILMKVAVKAFGEEWGPVIATIIALVAMNWSSLSNLSATVASTGITANMVIQASLAVAQIYNSYAQGQLAMLQKELTGLTTEFDKQMKEIEDLTKANLDTNTDLLDIYGLTQATNQIHFESSNSFLSRTLMTGSDVCYITSSMIENFVEVGLQLPTTG